MSDKQLLEAEITKLCSADQHLVRECAHEVQQVLDRYQASPAGTALALALTEANLRDSIKY